MPEVPDFPTVLYGSVTENGIEVANASVTITNNIRGGSIIIISDEYGNYVVDDLAILPYGYIDGDSIKISFLKSEIILTPIFGDVNLQNLNVIPVGDSILRMLSRLTSPYSKETTSNNYKLLSIVGGQYT